MEAKDMEAKDMEAKDMEAKDMGAKDMEAKDMGAKELMTTILLESQMLALATAVDNVPYVRIMDCVYDPTRENVIYLFTFKESAKISQFALNDQVAVTTVPVGHHRYLRSRSARIVKSRIAMEEILGTACQQIPGFEDVYTARKDDFCVYEILLKEVTVQDDMYHVFTLGF